MKPKNYGKDISSVTTPVLFYLPNGGTRLFQTSAEALRWFDLNYKDGYSMIQHIPVEGSSENPVELPELVVTANAPTLESTPAQKTAPTRRGVDLWAGANYSPSFNKHFYGTSDRDALLGESRVKGVSRAWQRNPEAMLNWTEGGNIAAGMVAAPFALEAAGAAYSIPEVAGALNLYGSYEGISRLTSDEGIAKTYNKFKSGDYLGGAKSLGGDVLDITMSLPFLNRVRQISYNAAKPSILGYRMSKMPLGEVETPNLTPLMRYRLGDVEINDPNLNYRQGASGTVRDFQNTGLVRVRYEGQAASLRLKTPGKILLTKSFNNPMFKLGGLWYDGWIMDEVGASPSFPDLLVTRLPLQFATKGSGPARADLGGRRIPFSADLLNPQNTSAFVWEPGYGFRRMRSDAPKVNYSFYQRPSRLTDAERAGVPRGERNQPFNPKANPTSEFEKQYGTTPSSLSYPKSIGEIIPNQLPVENFRENPAFRYTAPYDNWVETELLGGSLSTDYIKNLREYLGTLPKIETSVEPGTIKDYRTFLSRNGINPYELSDLEISALILDQYSRLSSQMTGKLKGVPMFHGGYEPIEQFNFLLDTGKGLFNMGAQGPGNYFSTGRHNYGNMKVYNERTGQSVVLGDMQPYLINKVESTPLGATLQGKGIVPKYLTPPNGFNGAMAAEAELIKYRSGHLQLSPDRVQRLEEIVNQYRNSPEYLLYVRNNISPYLRESNSFIIDSDALGLGIRLGLTVNPLLNGLTVTSLEGMIPRNSGIKSLFPHPSTLLRDVNGNWFISRDWNDLRVNYKKGGKLNVDKRKQS